MQSGNDRRWYRCVDAALLRAAAAPGETTLPPWPSPQCPDAASAAQWRVWLRLASAGPRAAEAVEIASPVLARRIEAVIGGAAVDVRRVRARPDGQWLDTVVTVLESDPALPILLRPDRVVGVRLLLVVLPRV